MMKINETVSYPLGMEPMQAKVYLAALELGEATIQALARKSGVNRSTIYTFIEEVTNRGYLLETKKGKRRAYSAAHPDRLYDIERKRFQELEGLMPELLAINNASQKKPKVTYHEGWQGVEEVYKDMLRDKKEIVAYEDIQHLKEGLPKELFDWFPKERAKRDILIRSISRDTPEAREFSKRNIGLLRETKFLSTTDLKTDINVYGDKVSLMDLRGAVPFCVLIENKHLADTVRTLWHELWIRLDVIE